MDLESDVVSDVLAAFPPVTSLIPHRAPMALLDHIVSADQENLRAAVIISAHSTFYDEQTAAVGAWLGIEYMAQAIAAFEGYGSLQRGESVKIGFLLGARNYESHCSGFVAGMVLHVDVHRVLQHENGLGAFDCRIIDATISDPVANPVVLATATVTVFKPDDANQFLKSSESSRE
jgi:predicted hotdog family 3-hydroxylacyl-ACP dehydratase